MKKLLFAICCFATALCHAQDHDVIAIRKMLLDQVYAWNAGSVDGYMKGYWPNDSMVFIGSKGPTYGYAAALERYRKAYPDADHMGKLTTHISQMDRVADDCFFVIGSWALERKAGNVSGSFTLLIKRIKGEWVIVCDHSS
jgi:ketosteroid isomerase-like protein